MSENQAEIDALMAEVNSLANEAVSEIDPIAGEPEPAPPTHAGRPPAPPATATAAASAARAPAAPASGNLQRVLHLEVPVIVRLAERSMPLAEILNLTSGAIIEFDKPADGELDLLINNKCIAHGLAVKVSENFGLRVTRIGSLHERIQALGS